MSTVQKVVAGKGRIRVHSDGREATLSELSYSYPLKLLAPHLSQPNVAVVYVLTYGGGLVASDCVDLDVQVNDGSSLVLLTQGTTKVFKTRPGQRRARPNAPVESNADTSQRMAVHVGAGSALFLLPDPVTCFRSARYSQVQRFDVAADASVVLLDWITSGRKALGEDWVFDKYYSLNELWVDGQRVARDAQLLQEEWDIPELPVRSLADRLNPYSCYANIIMYGPLTGSTIEHLSERFASITVFKHSSKPSFVWSLSKICEGKGAVVRVAAESAEAARCWMGQELQGLNDLVGEDVYRRTFGG